MRRKGNVLSSVLILCIFLGAFTSLMCKYSLRIMAEDHKISKLREERLERERLECEVKGRGMYVFSSCEGLEKKIELFCSAMEELGFKPYERENSEYDGIKMTFKDLGIGELKVEIRISASEKIDKLRVEVINF